ncbi:hypothetical protein IW136_000181 [Coemansia sp. RSA 678]|nr:hypothetical protein IW136_000181 [Coemansia sp. RSA 678]
MYACTFVPDNLQSILDQLGGDWSAEWQKALDGEGVFAEDSIWSNIGDGSLTYIAGQGAGSKNKEEPCQAILHALMCDIEFSLQERGIGLNLQWCDSHATPIEDGRMPDGLVHICGPGINPDWKSAVVVFELKSDKYNQSDLVLWGQLLWSFIAMAKNQPRRFTLGFSVSKKGELYIYLCTTEKVCYAKIGVLPYCTKDKAQVTKAVRFLLLVYTQLPKDTGILMPKEGEMSETFRAQDILHGCSIDSVSDLSDMEITILSGKARSGRREALFGPRSWIFDACKVCHRICESHFKVSLAQRQLFRGCCSRKGYRVKGSAYSTACGSNCYSRERRGSVAGEMLLLDDAGKDIYAFFKNLRPANSYQMTDMFAGYFHALLAAATGDGRKFVLHRDISVKNLLVKNMQPFLIDWGCGIVADIDIPRVASNYAKVGTAPFMGLRVLSERSNRSLIDDLESLFIVFAHCLWLRYGTIPAEDKKYWDGTAPTNELISFRIDWLLCENSLIDRMKLENCPEELRNLATAMRELVYPLSKMYFYNIRKDVTDPRLATFNAREWVAAFDTAAASSKSTNITRVNLEHLREYVENTPECNTLLIDKIMLQPALNSGSTDNVPDEAVSLSPCLRGKGIKRTYNLRSKKNDTDATSAVLDLKAEPSDTVDISTRPKRSRK